MKKFEEIIKECEDYGAFTKTPATELQATKSLGAFMQEVRECYYDDYREDDIPELDRLHLRWKWKAAEHSKTHPDFLSFLKAVFEDINKPMAPLGREGFLDDTKPTIHEAKRLALQNNEKAMQVDSKAFYADIERAIAVQE